MKNVRIFFTLSSALIVAASVYGVSADAQKSDLDQCTAGGLSKAECACELALQKGTQKALRDFLKLYENADTACNALASTATVSNGGDISSNGASSSGASSSGASSSGASSSGASSSGASSSGASSSGASSSGASSSGASSSGASSSGASSSGASSSGANPGNDKPVGNAGESPNGSDFGDGVRGKSQ
jgi:uncharacterized protein YjbI with pentapeptide repeats